jgi:hypothetical protein
MHKLLSGQGSFGKNIIVPIFDPDDSRDQKHAVYGKNGFPTYCTNDFFYWSLENT